MQADTNDRFLNVQIFAGLLSRIRRICIERLINHLTIVEIEDLSQTWYRDFFRLAGFYRCRCQSSAGSTLQLEARNCLASTETLARHFASVYETVSMWLAQGRCTRALLASVASGAAVGMELGRFHDLLAELENEEHYEGAQARSAFRARDRSRSQRSWQDCVKRSAEQRRKVLRPGSKVSSLKKNWSSQDSVVRSIEGSDFRVRKKRRQTPNTE